MIGIALDLREMTNRVPASRRLVVLLVVSVLTLLTVPTGAKATFPGRNGDLLIEAGTNELWLSGPFGHRPRKIFTTTSSSILGAEFSPSGTQIAVQLLAGTGRSKLVVVGAKGGGERTVATFPFGGSLAWSPDGHELAYACALCARGGKTRVVFVAVGSRKASKAFTVPGFLGGPVWSENGQLLFAPGGNEIDVCRPDGSDFHKIYASFPGAASGADISNGYQPGIAPSPDGTKLALAAANQPNEGAVFLAASTGGKTRHLPGSAGAPGAVWSPSGQQIEFSVLGRRGRTDKVLNLATRQLRTLPIPRMLAPNEPSGEVLDWQAILSHS